MHTAHDSLACFNVKILIIIFPSGDLILSHDEPAVQREWTENINYVIANVSNAAAATTTTTTPLPPLMPRPASAAAMLGSRNSYYLQISFVIIVFN